jgi:ribonuclease HI
MSSRARGKTAIRPSADVQYLVYCDGASRKDGRGGYGIHIQQPGKPHVDLCGGDHNTTNNRMELLAVIEAAWHLPEGSNIVFVCDSQYVIRGATEYMTMWLLRGWRTADNKPVKNQDLWEEYQRARDRHNSVEFMWVRGHTGNPGNERADALAAQGVPERTQ